MLRRRIHASRESQKVAADWASRLAELEFEAML
jgi:hypothetical protein